MLVAPERLISSPVTTWIAESASSRASGSFVTEVTSMFMRSSTLSFFKSPTDGSGVEACAARRDGSAAASASIISIRNRDTP